MQADDEGAIGPPLSLMRRGTGGAAERRYKDVFGALLTDVKHIDSAAAVGACARACAHVCARACASVHVPVRLCR